MAARAKTPELTFRRLTPKLVGELGTVLKGSWGRDCWCMFPRLTPAMAKELPGLGSARLKDAMTKLARRRRAWGPSS